MSRRLKVAEDTQIVYRGKHYFAGETFTADNQDAAVDTWVERGYVVPAAKGGRDVVRKNRRKAISEHRTAQARGLDPQALEGRGDAPPATQQEWAAIHRRRA